MKIFLARPAAAPSAAAQPDSPAKVSGGIRQVRAARASSRNQGGKKSGRTAAVAQAPSSCRNQGPLYFSHPVLPRTLAGRNFEESDERIHSRRLRTLRFCRARAAEPAG